jgi:hypothetical protein
MTKTQFIAILVKALAGMDKQSRDDILLEIKSHADESGNNDNALSEQFGAPEELVKISGWRNYRYTYCKPRHFLGEAFVTVYRG